MIARELREMENEEWAERQTAKEREREGVCVCVCLRSGWLQSVCVQGGCRGREVRKKEKETREGEERRDAGG